MAQVRIELNEDELADLGRRLVRNAEQIEGDSDDIESILAELDAASRGGEAVLEWVAQARRLLAAQLAAA